jgi:HSP20 family protein
MTFRNELLRLQSALDSLQRASLPDFFFGSPASGVFPPVNVFRDEHGDVVLRAELPGLRPEDIEISCEQRTLMIRGERKAEQAEGGGSYHRRERASGKFSRSIRLPGDLDPSRAAATFKHGVLTLQIPRAETAKPRQIAVQVA